MLTQSIARCTKTILQGFLTVFDLRSDLEMMKYSYPIPTFKGVEGVTPELKSLPSAYVLPLCHPIYHWPSWRRFELYATGKIELCEKIRGAPIDSAFTGQDNVCSCISGCSFSQDRILGPPFQLSTPTIYSNRQFCSDGLTSDLAEPQPLSWVAWISAGHSQQKHCPWFDVGCKALTPQSLMLCRVQTHASLKTCVLFSPLPQYAGHIFVCAAHLRVYWSWCFPAFLELIQTYHWLRISSSSLLFRLSNLFWGGL